MKFTPSEKINFSTKYILLGGFLLMIFIILLLLFYYKNNAALQESSLNRFQLDVANKAATLEYFFLERKYDIRNLADAQEIQTYFNNRAMGMSEEYGLKVSIFAIGEILRKVRNEKNIDKKNIYSRIDFLDCNQSLLASSMAPLESTEKMSISKKLNFDAISQEPGVTIEKTKDHNTIVFVAPCVFKKRTCGWVLAYLNCTTFYNHFLSPSTALSSKVFNLTLANGAPVMPLPEQISRFPWQEYNAITSNGPVRVTVDLEGQPTQKVLFMRIPIQPFPLYLSGYVKQNEIFGRINTVQFIIGAVAVLFIILFGLLWSIQTKMKHLLLQTRFDESTKQQSALTRKNLQLKEEITKRVAAEKSLIENEERYRKLFESSSDAILIMKGSRVIACNQKTVELFKLDREKILIHHLYDFCPGKQQNGIDSKQACHEKIQQAIRQPQRFEWKLQTPKTGLIDTEVTMTAINLKTDTLLQVLVRDITEKKHTQELLVQTEKMMAVGGLAAGMAHEINNPLGIILQACQNATRRLNPALKKNIATADSLNFDIELLQQYLRKRKIFSYLESIHSAGERAAQIVKSMLNFGRSSTAGNTELCDINLLLDETLKIAEVDYNLKNTYDFKKINIYRQYGTIEKIICAKNEIGQVFLNIIKNAAQAMGSGEFSGKTPEITLYTAPEENGVLISISDNGPGIPSEIQKTIFEPFFTTKPVGEGTGLGLSVSYFIITAHHNGQFRVNSKPGEGTTFTIQLPVNDEENEQDAQSTQRQ